MHPARSERELRRLQRRIDFAAPQRDGYYVQSTVVDMTTAKVIIELVTAHTDHLAYFQARYGGDVTTKVIATDLTSPACARLFTYRVAHNGAGLIVEYESGGGIQFDHQELAEYDDRVEIAVVVQARNGVSTRESRRSEQTIALSRPLGSRLVIDAATGKRLVPDH